jgi:hypothetical protein
MTQAEYSLGSSLSFLLILNLSLTIGALLAGLITDKNESKRIISIAYLAAAVSLAINSKTFYYISVSVCRNRRIRFSGYYTNSERLCNQVLPFQLTRDRNRLGIRNRKNRTNVRTIRHRLASLYEF